MSDNPKDFYGIDDEIKELAYNVAKLSVVIAHNKELYAQMGYTWSGGPLSKELERYKQRLEWAIKAKEKHHGEASKESIQQSTSGGKTVG
jgi:hypothetical protein